MKGYTFYLQSFIFILLMACQSSNESKTNSGAVEKTSPNDPFKNSIVKSEFYDINGNQDNVIESKNGTVLFVPKGAFLDKEGKPISGRITIELAEPSSMSEMLLSNLTVTSNGVPLNSAGILYVNASANGLSASIDPDNALYAEMVSDASRDGMEVYTGERDDIGKMNWKDPKLLENWLVPVDLNVLDFYPPNFETKVEKGMPFRNYSIATKELKDSLYYSLTNELFIDYYEFDVDDSSGGRKQRSEAHCGVISPASIKVLKDKKFQNTLISTREFEKRLKIIFGTCNKIILEVYVQNLDKNLWEIDSMAAETLGKSNSLYDTFVKLAAQKLTKVKDSPETTFLSSYYAKQIKKTEMDLLEAGRKYEELLQKKDKKAEEKREEYKKLLEKRQIYRLEKFGFKIKKNAYYTIAQVLEHLEKFELNVNVNKGKEFDRVHVYIVNPLIKSLFAMVSDSNELFDRGYNDDQYLLMWKEQMAVALVVAYKDNQPYFAQTNFKVEKENSISLTPRLLMVNELNDTLDRFERYSKINKITVDLAFQESFYKEKKRQELLRKEREFINELKICIMGNCCIDVAYGKFLFEGNCRTCHCKSQKKVGPALQDISLRRSDVWISKFIRNSEKLIMIDEDPDAIALFKEYNGTSMSTFPTMNDSEIASIIAYLNSKMEDDCYLTK